MKRAIRILVAVLLALTAVGLGARSAIRVRQQRRAIETCDAAQRQDWTGALASSEGLRPRSPIDLDTLDCRCRALHATGRIELCLADVQAALESRAGAAWAPPAWLVPPLVERWRLGGQDGRAADLLARAGRAYADDPALLQLEYQVRAEVEGERVVLEDLAARLAAPGATDALRIRAAHAYRRHHDFAAGLAALGEAPPAVPGTRDEWFKLKGRLHAQAGDDGAVRANAAAWRAAGGGDDLVLVHYAASLAEASLGDPSVPQAELLGMAAAAASRVGDPLAEEYITAAWINQLVAEERHAEALAAYEGARARLALAGITPQGIELSRIEREIGRQGRRRVSGELVFSLAAPLPGARLSISPDAALPADAPYEDVDLGPEGVRRTRSFGHAPVRWVLWDEDGARRSSGTVWPRPDSTRTVAIEAGPAVLVQAPRDPVPGAADGHPRVLVLVIDCMDWRMARYLLARGEMPALAGMLARGWSAVLWSDPPYTSTAMDFLVHPNQGNKATVVGTVYDVGGELVDMVPSGKNPFAFLTWLMPEQEDVFGGLAAGGLRAANLLFSHGVIDAGRHGEVYGPGDRRGERVEVEAFRAVRPDELARVPGLAEARSPYHRQMLQETAGMLDAAVWVFAESDLDVCLMRVVPMDRLTHGLFNAATAEGQDDGAGLLLAYYRYIDLRLGDVLAAMDGDDRLVFMSDHGIRNSVEHDNPAIFALVGAGVPAGRAEGTPHLRGVPRSLADLLGVATAWPDTGITPWAAVR